jgi:glycosyltransferase involved in cell wall biosynthesis
VLANPLESAGIVGEHISVIPNGYTVPLLRGVRPVQPRPRLLFVGVMHYFPNTDGALFLAQEVVPRLRELVGDQFEIRIVGHPPPVLQQLNDDPNIVVTGFVDDLASELNHADLVVVPLRHGTGTRLKILEAFAHAIPVVSTAVGASGLGCTDGHELLLADTPEDFAAACARLLSDVTLREHLAREAYALVADEYDWKVIGQRIGDLVESVATTSAGDRS